MPIFVLGAYAVQLIGRGRAGAQGFQELQEVSRVIASTPTITAADAIRSLYNTEDKALLL